MKIVFNHIPKTAGRSFDICLAQSFERYARIETAECIQQADSIFANNDCISLHIDILAKYHPNYLELLKKLMETDVFFISVIRHPIDMLVSLWRCQWLDESTLYSSSHQKQWRYIITFEEWVTEVFMANYQSLCLTFFYLPNIYDFTQQYYIAIGCLDYLQEFVYFLQCLGIIKETVTLSKINVNNLAPPIKVDVQLAEKIRQKYAKDFEFYEYIYNQKFWVNEQLLEMLSNQV